jgi:hypothetical protein
VGTYVVDTSLYLFVYNKLDGGSIAIGSHG